MDSTTPEPTATTDACLYCKRSDVPLHLTTYTRKLACDTCTELVDASMERRGAQAEQIPAAWEEAAVKAGKRAADTIRIEYKSTLQAQEAQRASDAPAYWLATHPCPAWCTDASLHRSSDHPDDRQHDSDVHAVSFDTMEPSVGYAVYAAPQMTMALTARFREVSPRVSIEMDGEPVGYATLDEAEQVAFHLLALVRLARGQEPLKVLPYDEHGRCVTADCVTCRVEASA